MTAGPDLTSAPLARGVLARRSWRPAGAQGTQRLLGGLAARREPMLAGARSLQAWHDGLARRWRPLDTVQPALTLGGAVAAGSMAAPPAPIDAAAALGSPASGGAPTPTASSRGRAVPRIDRVAGARVQRLAAMPAPARPALTIAALAAPAAFAAPLPAPFRPAAPAPDLPPGGPALVPAIGRRPVRREVAGGFPAAPRGPVGGGEMPSLVQWWVVRPSSEAPESAGAQLPAPDHDADRRVAPASPERSLPAGLHLPLRGATDGADLVRWPGGSEANARAGLSLRLVPPEEAARRLVPPEEAARRLAPEADANGRRKHAAGARTEVGARREQQPSAANAALDIDHIVERVQQELKRRERFERERKGLF
jgi:hypothetical protein